MAPDNCAGSDRGFSLVEVVVALAVATVALVPLVSLYVQSSTGFADELDRSQAILEGHLAVETIADLLVSGVIDEGVFEFSRESTTLQVNPVTDLEGSSAALGDPVHVLLRERDGDRPEIVMWTDRPPYEGKPGREDTERVICRWAASGGLLFREDAGRVHVQLTVEIPVQRGGDPVRYELSSSVTSRND